MWYIRDAAVIVTTIANVYHEMKRTRECDNEKDRKRNENELENGEIESEPQLFVAVKFKVNHSEAVKFWIAGIDVHLLVSWMTLIPFCSDNISSSYIQFTQSVFPNNE